MLQGACYNLYLLCKVYWPFSPCEESYLNVILLFMTLWTICLLDFLFSFVLYLLGRRSGILIVKILEVHEECTIQIAMCEQLAGLQADSPSPSEGPGTGLKVLFTKETTHYLRGQPQDVIHIYPPWWVQNTDSKSDQQWVCLKRHFYHKHFLHFIIEKC